MAPFEKNASLQSTVTKIASKLRIESTSLEAVENDFRVAKARIPIGKLPNDSAESRAAVLLQAHNKLAWKEVSAAVGMNTKKLQKLQTALRNHLHSTMTTTKTTHSSVAPRQTSTSQRSDQKTTKRPIRGLRERPTEVYVPKQLSKTVMRLAGYLSDPMGVEKNSRTLLERIYAYQPTSKVDLRGHLYDLQRYGAAYEAAVVFHIATAARSASQPQQQQHDPPFVPIRLEDVVEVSDGSTTLLEAQQILPRVRELANQIEPKTNAVKEKRRRYQQQQQLAHEKRQKKIQHDDSWIFDNLDDPTTANTNTATTTEANNFELWREQILKSAVEHHGSLALAAQNVFKKHGLGLEAGVVEVDGKQNEHPSSEKGSDSHLNGVCPTESVAELPLK